MDNKNGIYRVILPLVIALAFAGGIWLGTSLNKNEGVSTANQKLGAILNLIGNEYVEDVDLDSLVEQTLPDLLANLDPHSVYIPKSELQGVNDELEGSFSGIGVQFMINNDTITIVEAISGGPSEKVGLQAGDRIVTVDGENVAGIGITNEGVQKRLKGDKGSRVTLGIRRNTAKEVLEFEVIRGDVPVSMIDAAYMYNDHTGYIRVKRFGRTTYDEFFSALLQLTSNGADAFIIDLRGNAGGFMEMAVLMANEFLEDGQLIVAQKGRGGKNDKAYFADGSGSFKHAQIVVLQDEYSASSSEIFAGAIQDNDRGLILGRRSFGKGLIQRQADLPDSSAIRLTIARYYTPSGRCIQKDYSDAKNYENDIVERYNHGEAFEADSIRQNKEDKYTTAHGRTVYGGGGVTPDIFVPLDTTGVTTYYLNVANAGLLNRFAFEYCDLNREQLKDMEDPLKLLPDDETLIRSFANYARQNGIAPRWYYIRLSQKLILSQIKALIARDTKGMQAYFEIVNVDDNAITAAVKEIEAGNAEYPIMGEEKDE
ncbi:MAG: S41 family peptidase [Muribaculaceae bacterium]